MQVIRNKGGYVIRVTNVEWHVLRHIHDEGYMWVCPKYMKTGSAALRALRNPSSRRYTTRPDRG